MQRFIVCPNSDNVGFVLLKYTDNVCIKLNSSQVYHLHHLSPVTLQVSRDWYVVRSSEDIQTEMAFIKKVKYESIKTLLLICPFKLAPLIIINLLHYISLLNYMCYKVIIALKDAYCDPSSLQSGVEFSLVINKGVLVWEVLTSIDVTMKLKDPFKRPFPE